MNRSPPKLDPLDTLRLYRDLAPWNVRGLAALVGAVLRATAIRPTSGTATETPTVRSLRFYVSRGLIDRPVGKGPAAVYTYRHLLQVLTIKLRQMEGQTLEQIGREVTQLTGDAMERRLAHALTDTLPHPGDLDLDLDTTTGRAGHTLRRWRSPDDDTDHAPASVHARWHRLRLGEGLELHVHEGHPLADHLDDAPRLHDALRRIVHQFLQSR